MARKAGVSRVTFYHYYHDLYDLAGAVCAGEMKRAVGENRTPENWETGISRLMDTLRQNRWLLGKLRFSDGWGQIERVLRQTAFQQVMDVITRYPIVGIAEEDLTFIAHFYEHALVGFIMDWASAGMKEEPEWMVRRLKTLLTGQLETALRQFGAAEKEENRDVKLDRIPGPPPAAGTD